jgi:Ni/Co efflux regulator RcnB
MKHIAATVLSLSLLVTGSALAAPGNDHGRNDGRGQPRMEQPSKAHALRGQPPMAKHGPLQRPGHGPQVQPPRYSAGTQHGPLAAPPRIGHAPRRGDYLPPQARGYRVADYQRHGLRPPPRGHEWRRVGGRDLLIAVATGVIADIIFHGR